MSDLINRAEAVKRLLSFKQSRAKSVSRYDMGFVDGLSHAINIIDLVPSAYDRPTIVRCKDCKWYGHLGCAIQIVDDTDKPNDNDFCSFGERSEG